MNITLEVLLVDFLPHRGLIGAAVPLAELAPSQPAIDQAMTSDKPSRRISLNLDRCVSIGNPRWGGNAINPCRRGPRGLPALARATCREGPPP